MIKIIPVSEAVAIDRIWGLRFYRLGRWAIVPAKRYRTLERHYGKPPVIR